MNEPSSYRERAAKIRRLVSGASGDAAEAALLLAKEYEARADDLESGPAVAGYLDMAERVGLLLNQRCKQAATMLDAERELAARLETSRQQRAIVEAQIETIIEMSCLLDIPTPPRAEPVEPPLRRSAA